MTSSLLRCALLTGCWGTLLCAGLGACSSSGAGAGGTKASSGASGSSTQAGDASGGMLNLSGGSSSGGNTPTTAGGGSGSGGGSNGGVANGGTANGGGAGASNQMCPFGDQLVHATSYGMATTLRICWVSASSSDLRYKVTMPTEPPSGGYVVVSFRKVSPQVEIGVEISPAIDDFALDSQLGAMDAGADYDTWFAAVPGTSFFIDVTNSNGLGALHPMGDFELSATYVPVDDAYEPNQPQAAAKPLTLGTPVKAYSFYGYGTSTNDFLNGWYDFYEVTLSAGTPSVTLTGVPQAFPLDVSLQSPSIIDDASFYGTTLGSDSVTVTPPAPVLAGDYLIVITPSHTPHPYGKGALPDAYATQQYTLTVTE